MEITPADQRITAQGSSARRAEFQEVAVALEASFLSEMLKFAGHGESRESFGGGKGEDAFTGLLVREQAALLADGGGIGLAEQIVESMMRRAKNV